MLTIRAVSEIFVVVEIARCTPRYSINGGSSSAVERQIVDLLVEGSIPFFHPTDLLKMEEKALLAQRIERRTSNPQVVGSSPTGRVIFGPLAQLVEQQTLNLWVKGSIPLRLMTPREW